ncbi:WD40 repeat-like protein [Macroventuria anomochaeta]|uniref:WD40 repeat-like protein n=1 Tax=Macroventuria anomochaeta TaxID=301207 RepID=A0ACB6SGL3_9PLEO|nr:WD40 repeat-like protein [Macroventuria anomochaeta]KAF2633169.1 WD40 repeat-like protein [Macroventuria anomochaeta]
MVIDSDPLEGDKMEVVSPSPPGNKSATAVRVHQTSRSPLPQEPVPTVVSVDHGHGDSAVLELPVRQSPRKVQQSPTSLQVPKPVSPPAPAPTKPLNETNAESATKKADHLLIFLKEVKRLKWADVAKEFAKDIPGCSYVQLQSRYSQTLNKRDRSQDPPTLNLPPRFAAEATIDWALVHANAEGPRVRKQVVDLGISGALRQHHVGRPRAVQQVRDNDDSSGTDSAPQRQRRQRAAPVNYTWPKLRTTEGGVKEWVDEEDSTVGLSPNNEAPTRLESPADRTLITPGTTTLVQTKPLEINFYSKDAQLGLTLQRGSRNVQQERVPYLSWSQRLAMRDESEQWIWDQWSIQDWQGVVLHVDFSPAELQTVEKVFAKVIPPGRQTRHSTYRRHLRTIFKDLAEPRLQKLAHEIGRHLHSRDAQSIKFFLEDAAAGKVSDVPQIQRFALPKPSTNFSSIQKVSVPSLIRQRELGQHSRRGWQAASTPLTYQTKDQRMDTLGPKSTWTGASSDLHTVAWSPDGQYFAAGAVAVTDSDSMQYNRPNVLMYGDTTNGNIHELGEHFIARPKTEAGANSTHAMYVSQDPKLYTTVSSVAFSPSGKLMYSAGYDETVCIWNVTAGSTQPQMVRQLGHKAPVDILAVNQNFNGIIATATKRTTDKSIKLVFFDEETVYDKHWRPDVKNFASAKALNRPNLNMSATALKFDPTGQLLLAGFGAYIREDSGLHTSGDICLWDVETQTSLQVYGSSRNVFDVAFNPAPRFQSLFAVGCVANGNVNRGTRSVVRFYTTKGTKGGSDPKLICPLELECKAFDMNDVVWCPYDENLIAAGCTDGRSYVWDLRRPDRLLYTLPHGSSLMPLQDGVPHERTDTGVRFLSWGQNARRLYSGSSDGVVKIWDVTRSHEDAYIRDLITTNSGIMSGAFTTDHSKLVLGEVNGTANVLEVGRDDILLKDADKLQYHPYRGKDDEDVDAGMDIDATSPVPTDTAAAEARKWLETGQLRLAPMGGLPKQQVIQGPNYEGPFDRSEDTYTDSLRDQAFEFQNMATAKGLQCALSGCSDSINVTTFEEVGDSGRSQDRIPDELRRQWLDETPQIVPGKLKCTYCSRPAFPSKDADSAALCERCSFTCFRCGGASYITGHTTTLDCGSCGGVWNIGALGYECDQKPMGSGSPLDVPALKRFGKESYLERLEDVDTTFGDEMNALTDYYFGLAIDRPESPPL